jgi:hypothetical protein
MKSTWFAGIIATAALGAGAASAQAPQPPAPPPGQQEAPQTLEGRVVSVDVAAGTAVIETNDGQRHEFRGTPETLRGLQPGQQVELNRRR